METLNKIETLKYKKARKKYLEQIIQRIGSIEETDHSVICHVKQEMLEKNGKRVFYELNCEGFNTANDASKKLVEYFGLNKTVYYIFDGITFDCVVNIACLFSNIIFKNCTFNTGIRCFFADNIILENNKYNCWTEFKDYGNAFLYGKIRNLTIKNEQFINNSDFRNFKNNFGINIDVDELNIENSTICAGNRGQINVKAKKTSIWNLSISAPEIYLDSDNLEIDKYHLETKDGNIIHGKSLLKAEKGIIIENKNCNADIKINLDKIESTYVIYNGNELIPNYGIYEDEKLKEKRLVLVNVLTNVIMKCNKNTLVKSVSLKKEN